MEALKGHLKAREGNVEETEGRREGAQVRGGVIIVWDTSVWKRANRTTGEVLEPGRVVTVELKAIASGAVVQVVGVYAPCRATGAGGKSEGRRRHGGRPEKGVGQSLAALREERDVQDTWEAVEDGIMGGGSVIVAGDMNAELQAALGRAGRAGTEQDKKLQELVRKAQL